MADDDYEHSPMNAIEIVFCEIMEDDIIVISKLLGINMVNASGLLGRIMGRINACVDESMKDNEEVKAALVKPGMEHMLTGIDTHETFMKNYEAARDRHIDHHMRRRLVGEKAVDALMERLKGGKT